MCIPVFYGIPVCLELWHEAAEQLQPGFQSAGEKLPLTGGNILVPARGSNETCLHIEQQPVRSDPSQKSAPISQA